MLENIKGVQGPYCLLTDGAKSDVLFRRPNGQMAMKIGGACDLSKSCADVNPHFGKRMGQISSKNDDPSNLTYRRMIREQVIYIADDGHAAVAKKTVTISR